MFEPLLDSVPEDIDIEVDGNDCSALVTIARCQLTERVSSVLCALAHTTNVCGQPSDRWFHEFSFSITCVALDDSDPPFETQNRDIAHGYIPASIRSLVIPIVLKCCTALIARVQPPVVYRVIKVRQAVAKAMSKHDLITEQLHNLGYHVTETGTDPLGRDFIVMARL